MSCGMSEVTLTSLSDHVLLCIFKFLNWTDSINLAVTCKRMENLKYWLDKGNQQFDFSKYVDQATVPVEKVLTVIGAFIRVANITEQVLSESLMRKCCNIKSLKIDECVSQSAAITLNAWMKELKVESLFIGDGVEGYVEELLTDIEGLNRFVFDNYQKLMPRNFFHKNSSIQHLRLVLVDYYALALDLSSLLVVHSLQSLFLTTERTAVLDDVRKYVKLDQLNEFSIYIQELDDWDADIWNNFAKYLAEITKLDKFRMIGFVNIDDVTFSTLSLMNLTSLSLNILFSWEDFSLVLHESTAPRLKYLRLNWQISWCSFAKIGHILKRWATIEALCLSVNDASDLVHHFKDQFFCDIWKISDNRPALKIHIFSSEIYFNFISKRYDIIEEKKCCSCEDSFQLSETEE